MCIRDSLAGFHLLAHQDAERLVGALGIFDLDLHDHAVIRAVSYTHLDVYKRQAKKSYGKKGDAVVQMNWKAIDAGVDACLLYTSRCV